MQDRHHDLHSHPCGRCTPSPLAGERQDEAIYKRGLQHLAEALLDGSIHITNSSPPVEGEHVAAEEAFHSSAISMHLNTKVTKVEWVEGAGSIGNHGAIVTAEGGNVRYSADKVVIALPLGVLKAGDVEFEPPLSDVKQTAIENTVRVQNARENYTMNRSDAGALSRSPMIRKPQTRPGD
eukprot:SAG11_NODE_225_length_12064_cov_7.850815_5_plen_180_part_00